MIKVLIADDSAVVREFLSYILNLDAQISVVGVATDGEEAVKMVVMLKPDIVVMDIEMPKMNGFEATRKIMETNPLPIIIVTALWDPSLVEKTFKAMEAGALGIMEKPKGIGSTDYHEMANRLVDTVKTMSEVKVIRRTARLRASARAAKAALPGDNLKNNKIELVAIGASTGGPIALKTLLSDLPGDFVAVMVVQHISPGFTAGLVDWLNTSTKMKVCLARQNQEINSGNIYVAPDDCQMKLIENKIVLTKDPAEYSVRPSVSCLFRSVASYFNNRAVGVFLTGMGKDGAKELKMMRDNGCITIDQDKESSVVHGMPGEAINLDAVDYILPLDKIASGLLNLVSKGSII